VPDYEGKGKGGKSAIAPTDQQQANKCANLSELDLLRLVN
jgi:hypothetical protein